MRSKEPAFARSGFQYDDGSFTHGYVGLTTRDYIAIQTITGAAIEAGDAKKIAQRAYALADAMIEASTA